MNTNQLSVFFQRIRDIREDADMSQSQAAKLFGISRDALGRYERGERIPNIDFLFSYCEHFKISADYMLGRTDITNVPQIKVKTSQVSRNSLSDLDPDLRSKAEGYIDSLLQIQKERDAAANAQEA